MELSAFLTQLAESGVVVVTGDEALEPGDGADKSRSSLERKAGHD